MFEWIIYIVAILIMVAAVWAWHVNSDLISLWVKGGPKPPHQWNQVPDVTNTPTLSQRVDLMHQYRDKCLEQAAALEVDIAAARADVDAATKKLLPPQT